MSELPEGRLILFWILGSIAVMFGAWIAGNVEFTLGVTSGSYALAMLVAFILILFGGLAWIAVAVSVSQEEEMNIHIVKKKR